MGIDRVLIADQDFSFLARLKQGLLQFSQFEILTAHNGVQALDLLNRNGVSILVTDIFLPQKDGLELLATISRRFPNVLSIVATTADNLKKKTVGDSLFSYLAKPYNHIRLHTELIRVLDCLDEIHFKAGIYPTSMLPLVHLGKKSGLLVLSSEGNKTGSFYFEKGILREAFYNDLHGEDALHEMLTWGPGKYSFKRLPKAATFQEKHGDLTPFILEGTGLEYSPANSLKKGIRAARQQSAEKPVQDQEIIFPELPETFDLKPSPGKKSGTVRQAGTGKNSDRRIKPDIPYLPESFRLKSSPPKQQTEKKAAAVNNSMHRQQESVPSASYSHCRVLIVDDSKMIRKGLNKILSTDASLEIVGEAANGKEALELIKRYKPDVVTLDINMPVMDGLSTLKHMMIQCPTPTVMLSTLTHEGTSMTFDSLKYGAVDFMPKPSSLMSEDIQKQAYEIIKKIHLAAGVRIESVKYIRSVAAPDVKTDRRQVRCERVVCIGAAEGGYGALLKIIPKLSTELPIAHLVMIHATPQHVDAFVNYLSRHSPMRIQRIRDKLELEGATCYLASGYEKIQLRVDKDKTYTVDVNSAPAVSERTSINTLMGSVAEILQDRSIGVVLSGLGVDGSAGLQEIKKTGGTSIVQHPANCLYKEMAEEAMKHVDRRTILPDSKISETINKLCLHDT